MLYSCEDQRGQNTVHPPHVKLSLSYPLLVVVGDESPHTLEAPFVLFGVEHVQGRPNEVPGVAPQRLDGVRRQQLFHAIRRGDDDVVIIYHLAAHGDGRGEG